MSRCPSALSAHLPPGASRTPSWSPDEQPATDAHSHECPVVGPDEVRLLTVLTDHVVIPVEPEHACLLRAAVGGDKLREQAAFGHHKLDRVLRGVLVGAGI